MDRVAPLACLGAALNRGEATAVFTRRGTALGCAGRAAGRSPTMGLLESREAI